METLKATPRLYESIESYISSITKEFDQISQPRKEVLHQLSAYVREKTQAKQPVKLIFICTHNSRRSHISQVWAQTAAYYYGIQGVETYSGGTEATAFNPRAVKAMAKAGFQVEQTGEAQNPVYLLQFAADAAPVKAFSKVYDEKGNPQKEFAAIMTCCHADENCPYIPGVDARIAIPYDDPKEADNTPQEEARYDERTRQIAREVFYAFCQVK